MSYLYRTGNGRNNIAYTNTANSSTKYLRRTSTGRNNIVWTTIPSGSTYNILQRNGTGRNNVLWSNLTIELTNADRINLFVQAVSISNGNITYAWGGGVGQQDGCSIGHDVAGKHIYIIDGWHTGNYDSPRTWILKDYDNATKRAQMDALFNKVGRIDFINARCSNYNDYIVYVKTAEGKDFDGYRMYTAESIYVDYNESTSYDDRKNIRFSIKYKSSYASGPRGSYLTDFYYK